MEIHCSIGYSVQLGTNESLLFGAWFSEGGRWRNLGRVGTRCHSGWSLLWLLLRTEDISHTRMRV